MLPLKSIQFSYQDLGNLIWNHKQKIEDYFNENNIKLDLIIAKLRNGVHAGAIVSNYLNLPMGVIDIKGGNSNMLWPVEIDRERALNILVVDTVSNTGKSLNSMIDGVLKEQPSAKVFSYSVLISSENKFKPNILGECISDFIQPPWEWLSFTPSSHLERLESIDGAFVGKEFFIAFSSVKAMDDLEIKYGRTIKKENIKIYQNYADNKNIARSNSGFSSFDIQKYRHMGIDVYSGLLKRVITDKVNFILTNGVSHFIEESLEEAVLLAIHCPVTHILYIEKEHLVKIGANNFSANNLNL